MLRHKNRKLPFRAWSSKIFAYTWYRNVLSAPHLSFITSAFWVKFGGVKVQKPNYQTVVKLCTILRPENVVVERMHHVGTDDFPYLDSRWKHLPSICLLKTQAIILHTPNNMTEHDQSFMKTKFYLVSDTNVRFTQ